jgi:hypothetical protein
MPFDCGGVVPPPADCFTPSVVAFGFHTG